MAVEMVAMAVATVVAVAMAVAVEMVVATVAPARGEVAPVVETGGARVAALGAGDMVVVEENMAAGEENMAEAVNVVVEAWMGAEMDLVVVLMGAEAWMGEDLVMGVSTEEG